MQMVFGFGGTEDIEWLRDQLRRGFGSPGQLLVLPPAAQLVKSMISGRTRDEISFFAFVRLIKTYAGWSEVAHAAPSDLAAVISDVTFADDKARHLAKALLLIEDDHPDFDLEFLRAYPVTAALNWLERLPGVGRKVAASTLNFSTLDMPAFVVDTHVLRVLQRFGVVRSKADTRNAYDTIISTLPKWSAFALSELHVLIKHLGQTICQADRMQCSSCPIEARCHRAATRARSADRSDGDRRQILL